MPRRRSARNLPPARFVPVEPLEFRVLFSASVHNDSFDVTGLTSLRANATYSSITGAGIGIAVLDSGVDIANPDLTGQVVAYYNAVEKAIPTTAPGTTGATDNDGHGTHVSGIAASADPDIGVAYGAHLVDVKVIADSNEQQLSGDPLLRGLQFVATYAATYNIRVVNMSLGEASSSGGINTDTIPASDDISREIALLESMGITVVTASGNSYANDPTTGESYPAIVSTIAVASTWADTGSSDDFNTYAYGSAYDNYAATERSAAPDRFSATSQRSTLTNQVVAPGVDIYSDWNGSSTDNSGSDLLHNTLSGTSMATPFISGVVALMQQAALTYGGRYITDPEQVLSIIRATSDPITDSNVSDNGRVQISDGQLVSSTVLNLPETGDTYDRVNVLRAIEAVQALFTGTVSNTDIDDTTASAASVGNLDGTAVLTETGNIGTDGLNQVGANDVDLYKVTLTSPGALTAALSAGSATTFTADVRIFDANGNQLAAAPGTSTDGYPTLTAGTAADPLAIGTYYIGVSSIGNGAYAIAVAGGNQTGATGGTGDYSLSVTLSNPDPNGVVQGAMPIDLTDPTTFTADVASSVYGGYLGSDPPPTGSTTRVSVPDGDVDMFAVVAPDTGTVAVNVFAATYGLTGADSFVEVFTEDTAGHVTVITSAGVASNFGSDSQTQFPVVLGQTYYVAVTNYANRAFSPTNPFDRLANSTAVQKQYALQLTFDNGNTDGTARLASAATVGTTETGTIGSTVADMGANGGFKYVDWYYYTPTTAGLLDLTATATTDGFSPNVQLWTLVYDDFGSVAGITQVAGITGSGQSLISPVDANETVYVSVTGAGNSNFNWNSLGSGSGGQTGTYALSSSILSITSAAAKAINDNSIDDGTPGTITTGSPVSGDIGMDGGLVVGDTDVDLYRFTPSTTGAYDLRTGTGQEGSADTYLRLFTANGTQLASNDNADSTSTASFIRADLTAGVTYYVGVSGSGNSAYNPLDGTATTDASKTGLYNLSVAAATLPAITIASPAPIVPTAAGANLTFVVSLDQASNIPITVNYATADGSAVAGTDYTATSGTLTIAPLTTSATITVPVLLNPNADATLTFNVNLTSPSVGAVLDGGQATGSISDLPVSQLPFSAGHRATYVDTTGRTVVVSLTGPGSGIVSVVGDSSTTEVTLATTGTNGRSRLSIQPIGGITTLDGLQVTGSLASLAAAAVEMVGDLTVTGLVASLVIAGATGSHTLSIQGTNGVFGSLRLGTVSGFTVASSEALATLVATSWTDGGALVIPTARQFTVTKGFAANLTVTDGAGTIRIGGAVSAGTWTVGGIGTLSVGSTAAAWSADITGGINTFNVANDLAGTLTTAAIRSFRVGSDLTNATVTLTGAHAALTTLNVRGSITGSTIRAAGDIGTVKTGAMTGSTLFAGVGPADTALPTSSADFVTKATIGSFAAGAFADSDIAAAALGRVTVRKITTNNGGTPFGFAANTLAAFTDNEPGVATFKWTPKDPTTQLAFNGDFVVRLFS